MKITVEEQERRKKEIINVAFSLFCERGVEKVTITDIARRANVGDSTIYRYFTNKPLLVLNTLNALWKAVGESLEIAAEDMDDYENMSGYMQIEAWLECCRRLYEDNSEYVLFSYEAKLYLLRNGIKLTRLGYDALMESIKEPCVAALNKGKADHTIRVRDDSEDLFYAIWGVIRGYIVKIVIYRSLCEGECMWEGRYELVKNGILRALHSG